MYETILCVKPWTKLKNTQIDHQQEESVIDYLKHNVFQILYFRNIQVREYRSLNFDWAQEPHLSTRRLK